MNWILIPTPFGSDVPLSDCCLYPLTKHTLLGYTGVCSYSQSLKPKTLESSPNVGVNFSPAPPPQAMKTTFILHPFPSLAFKTVFLFLRVSIKAIVKKKQTKKIYKKAPSPNMLSVYAQKPPMSTTALKSRLSHTGKRRR